MSFDNLLVPDMSLLEIAIRGTAIYLGLFLMLRLILKRMSGEVTMSDLLVIVLIADASSNAMSNDYTSITDGLLLVAVIIFWNFALEWLGYRIPAVERLVHPAPLPLVKDGQLVRRNMRKELVTFEELMSQLREQGLEDVAQVKAAYIEGNGQFSIVPFEQPQAQAQ